MRLFVENKNSIITLNLPQFSDIASIKQIIYGMEGILPKY